MFWLAGATGSREWNDAAGSGEVWSSVLTSVKQVSGSRLDAPEGNTEFIQGCKREGWQLNFVGRPSPFGVREVAVLRGEREVKSFCWHLWKEGRG